MNYSKHVNNKATPQTQPILGKKMIKNNAGGYVFEASDWIVLNRFLILGNEGGTYYVGEKELTVETAKTVIELIKQDGMRVLSEVVSVVQENRAPKIDPSIFTLALLCTFGSQETKIATYPYISTLLKTSTHLFTFVSNIQNLRGWSRGLRRAVAKWYTSKLDHKLSYQMMKYRSRNGFTHKDVLRLSHPQATSLSQNKLFSYAVGKTTPEESGSDFIVAVEKALKATSAKELVPLIKEYNLTWEMIPTELLNNKEVLTALLPAMPITAVMRNLNRFTLAGLFESNLSETAKYVASKLTNLDEVKKSGIHPVTVLNAMHTYSRGEGFRGGKIWTPSTKIIETLESMFELALHNVTPTGKNILIAVDISGSMSASIANMSLSAREAAAALSLTFVKNEPNVDLIWFDTKCSKPKVTKNSSYNEVIRNTPNGGGTDCSIAFQYGLHTKVKYDAIIILTDNETWAGSSHMIQEYEKYSSKYNPNVKVVTLGMATNKYSLMEENNPNSLHIAGFDASVPEVIKNFICQ